MNIKKVLLEKFNTGEFEYKGAKRIFELLGVKSNSEKDIIRGFLNELEKDGLIVYDNGKYVLFEHSNLIKGVIKGNERGFAFLIPEKQGESDYFLPPRNLNGALHGDTVIIKKVTASRKGSSDEGEVISILSRGVKRLTGTVHTVLPDRIAASTYMCAAAAAGGTVKITNIIPKHLESITAKLAEMGADEFLLEVDSLEFLVLKVELEGLL